MFVFSGSVQTIISIDSPGWSTRLYSVPLMYSRASFSRQRPDALDFGRHLVGPPKKRSCFPSSRTSTQVYGLLVLCGPKKRLKKRSLGANESFSEVFLTRSFTTRALVRDGSGWVPPFSWQYRMGFHA